MNTDYSSHESVYRRRKAEGAPGWFTDSHDLPQMSQKAIEETLSAGRVPSHGRLLEIGCGAGNISVWLAKMGYDVAGIDIAPTAISWAKERAATENVTADFRVGNVVDLSNYNPDQFDIVLDGLCLHCIVGQDRITCLSSIFRILRPSGWFIHCSGCANSRTNTMQGYDSNTYIVSSDHIPAPRCFAPPQVVLDEINHAGFKVQGWSAIDTGHETDFLVVEAQKPSF